jgi:prevent-host-death family protein
MKTYGVRELRQNASKILDEVKQGELVTITEWGKPVATISGIEKKLIDKLFELGVLTPPEDPDGELPEPIKVKIKGGKTLSQVLEELRAEER